MPQWNPWGPGAKYMYRRLQMNGSLVTTSLADMGDDGDVVERNKQREMVDTYDEAIQLWQSHAPFTRKGQWPADGIIDQYVGYVKLRRENHDRIQRERRGGP